MNTFILTAVPTRREVLQGAAAALLASSLAGNALARPARKRPNFVFILADDLGYGTLGAYGQLELETPNLDRLAAEGLPFTDCYSSAPICAPSRCCLYTGMHTGHARVRDNSFTSTGKEPELLPEDVTFAEVLRAAGYRTGLFGKWGFGPDDDYVPLTYWQQEGAGGPRGDLNANVGHPSHPLQKGFDEFFGLVRHHHATEGYYPNYLWDGNRRVVLPENAGEQRGSYAPDLYTDRALDFMERHRDDRFAMVLTLQLAHWPNLVPDISPYEDKPWTLEQKRYAAMITRADTYVGMVRAKLEELGLDDSTLVMFTSDNGPTEERALAGGGDYTEQLRPSPDSAAADAMWDTTHGLRAKKHSLYEGGIRVPMIVWGPGIVRKPAPGVLARPWASYDVLPTLADFAGIAPPGDIDGVSVRPLITGEGDVRHPPLYWERPPYDALNIDGTRPGAMTYGEAVRDGRWKGIRYAPGTDPTAPDEQWQFEVYDLEADRGERLNVAATQPAVKTQLEAIMRREHAPAPYRRAPYRP
jgi:arylsulfatase A